MARNYIIQSSPPKHEIGKEKRNGQYRKIHYNNYPPWQITQITNIKP